MTATFWSVAALLCALAVAILLVLRGAQRRSGGRWSPAGLAAVVLIAPVALGLYFLTVSNWDPEYAAQREPRDGATRPTRDHLQAIPMMSRAGVCSPRASCRSGDTTKVGLPISVYGR